MGSENKNVSFSRKLLFVTGTRADFGKIEPLAKSAQKSGYQISFFITGMHMMKRYGPTNIEVKRFKNAEFYEFVNQREEDPLDLVLSKTILGFSDFIHEHKPDLVIIHGDRIEALAASIVCSVNYIRSAHIEGGEVSGTIDESFRHCNTKLCISHFVSNEEAKNRVLALGEPEKNIFVIGSPELDSHAQDSGVTFDDVKKRYGIPFSDFGIVIFHSVTSEVDSIAMQAESLFTRLEESNKNFVVIAPNNDPGTNSIIGRINRLPTSRFRILPSMRFNYFSELMKNSSVIIGNSSVGVREAPFLGIPSLDIGTRQNGRAFTDSIHKCNANEKEKIKDFIQNQWGKKYKFEGNFGSGDSSQKFIDILKMDSFWKMEVQKKFTE